MRLGFGNNTKRETKNQLQSRLTSSLQGHRQLNSHVTLAAAGGASMPMGDIPVTSDASQ